MGRVSVDIRRNHDNCKLSDEIRYEGRSHCECKYSNETRTDSGCPAVAYWRVTIDNPPINVMGPEMVRQFQDVINALEADEHVRVVVFDSAVDDYFLNHSDFM